MLTLARSFDTAARGDETDQTLTSWGLGLELQVQRGFSIRCDWGMALTEQGRLDEAVARYRKAIVLAPAYSHAYNNLAIVYAKQGRFDEAVPVFKQAIRLNPTNASFHRNLALAYLPTGEELGSRGGDGASQTVVGKIGTRHQSLFRNAFM